MSCIYCNGKKWIQKFVTIPARVYGEPRQASVAVPCKFCNQPKGEIFDGKAAATGER